MSKETIIKYQAELIEAQAALIQEQAEQLRFLRETEEKGSINLRNYPIKRNSEGICSFEEYTNRYLESKRGIIKDTSLNNYYWIYRTFIRDNSIGKRDVGDIKSIDLQVYINEWACVYSANLVRRVTAFVKAVLSNAMINEIIPSRHILVKAPDCEVAHKTFTEQEFKYVMQCCLLEENCLTSSLAVIFALSCGLRVGEICGLRWGDIDFTRGILKVTRNAQYVRNLNTGKYEMVIQTPKTKSSRREIPVMHNVLTYLHNHRQPDDYYIVRKSRDITSGVNKVNTPRELREHVYRWWDRKGIRKIKIHELRHTYASRLIISGADIKTVSQLLGHHNVDMTLNTYTHSNDMEMKKAVNTIEQSFL